MRIDLTRKSHPKRDLEIRTAAIAGLHRQGLSIDDIAKAAACSRRTVFRHLDRKIHKPTTKDYLCGSA